jgi:hypothetical protein
MVSLTCNESIVESWGDVYGFFNLQWINYLVKSEPFIFFYSMCAVNKITAHKPDPFK